MPFTYLLSLVSDRGAEQLRGKSKDTNWPGWIPVQSFGAANVSVAIGSSGGSRTPASPGFPGQECQFAVNSEDLDIYTLQRWLLNGEPVSAKLNVVPAAVGEEGYQLVFEGAMITSYRPSAGPISFSLHFERMERRYLMRYR